MKHPGLGFHSRRQRWLRALLARRRGTVLTLDSGRDLETIRETRERVPLLMQDGAALLVQSCVRAARSLDGDMAEAGVLLGGSARLICEEKGDSVLHLFDVFDSLQRCQASTPAPNEDEVRSHFGTVHGRLDQVEQLLSGYSNVRFHCGLFPGTAHDLRGARFSFVHLDLDLVQSTIDALEFFRPRLVPGGILIGDDYADPGVRDAFTRFFEPLDDTVIGLPWSQVLVVRQGRPIVAAAAPTG